MKEFQLGDTVKCIDKPRWIDSIAIGEEYTVELVTEDHIRVNGVTTLFKNERFELVKHASTDNEGFSLIEVLIVMVIMGILAPYWGRMMLNIAQANRLGTKQHNERVIPITSKCIQLDGKYYGELQDTDTLRIYTDNKCVAFRGTLGRLTNETWFNLETNSSWLVFNNEGLKLLIVKY